MSFIRPQRAPSQAPRRSRSACPFTSLRQANRRRNQFHRHPLRTSSSAHCLTYNERAELMPSHATVTTFTATATFAGSSLVDPEGSSFSGSESEYSEYDLVNEQMQNFLLDSSDSSYDEADDVELFDAAPYHISSLLATQVKDMCPLRASRPIKPLGRRRMAKKSGSSLSLSNGTRLKSSLSTALLCDLEAETQERVDSGGGAARRGTRRQICVGMGSAKRSLIPPPSLISIHRVDEGERRLSQPLFTVVFDLDETLVAARDGPICLRPNIDALLRTLHRLPVEIVVWTAGMAHYVNPILHAIGKACGRRQWFHHIISRHKRWYRGAQQSGKDLRLLGRRLDRLLLVENNPLAALPQPSLCLLLEDYQMPNPKDESLSVLRCLLERLAQSCEAALAVDRPPRDFRTAKDDDDNEKVRNSAGSQCVSSPFYDALELSTLMRDDPAVRSVEFRMDDLINEEGVSMTEKVELTEQIAGGSTMTCYGLQYTPLLLSSSTKPAASSVPVAQRSYGSVHPLSSQ